MRMTRRYRFIPGLALAVAASTLLACGNDTTAPPAPAPSPYHALSTRAAVLNNFLVSYNQRNISEYTKLLDPELTFFLSAGDVTSGLPDHWGYQEEVDYNRKMFDPTYSGPNRCLKIDMSLSGYDPTNIQWQSIVPDNYPDQMWYITTVFYKFRIDVVTATDADHQLLSPDTAKLQFTVRNVGTAAKPSWRLVELRDLGASTALAPASPASTEPSDLGKVKALYR